MNTLLRRIALAMFCALSSNAGMAARAASDAADTFLQPRSFEERCAHSAVVLCDPLDESPVRGETIRPYTTNPTLPAALNGKYGQWRWCTHSRKNLPVPPVMDKQVKASGSGSVRFTVAGGSAADGAGYCQMNFAPDLSVQFGETQTFFVQFKVRFDCTMLFVDCDPASPGYKQQRRKFRTLNGGGTAVKLTIINTGDHAALEFPATSCSNQHLVLVVDGRGVLQGYHSCEWYDSHREDLGLDKRTGNGMFDLQPRRARPGRPVTHCHHSGSPAANKSNPTEGCYLMPADEWITITQQIAVGLWSDRLNDPLRSSNIKVWAAREGEAPVLVIDYDRNLQRPEKPFMKYGKVWLVPYITDKSPAEQHPNATMWFDELIVGRGALVAPR